MISDANKGITGILYNYWDLPTEVKFNNSNTQKINYTYDAVGTKLRKVVNENGNITTTDYANSFVYKNGVLQFFEHPEGYVDAVNGYKYVYNYKDHLGNVRLVYSDSDNSGSVDSSEIIDEKNYYPFGLEHQGYNTNINGVENNHLTYNGKEFDKSLNLNTFDLGARQMDPALGRFMVIDPMADFVNYQSPYAVADNNPIGNIDFYGLGKTPWWLRWLLGGGGADCGCTQHEGVVGFIGRLFDPKPGKTGGGKKPKPPKKKGTKPDPKFANGDRDPISPIDFGNNGLADLKDLEIAAPQLGSLSMPKEESVKIRVGGKRYEPNEKIEVNIGFYQSQFKIKGSEITGKILNDIIKTLKEWPHLKVIIYGNIWSSKGNVNKNSEHNSLEGKMSVGDFQKGRANAILIFLEKRGISRSRIKVESGEISPNSKGASTTVEFID